MAIDLINANSTRYYDTPDHADWTFPNGSDWFLYIWTRVDDNSGSAFQYLISTGTVAASNTLNLYLSEDSQGANSGKWFLQPSTAQQLVSSTAPGGDGKDRLIGIQREGNAIQMWFVEKGQTAVKEQTLTSDIAMNGTQDIDIGRRVDGNTARYYEEHMGDLVKGTGSLTVAQWTLLGQGVSPFDVVGASNVDIWLPFREATATVNDLVSGKVATRRGSGHLTSEHFPYVQSNNMAIIEPGGAPPSGRIMGSIAGLGGLAGHGGLAGPGGGIAG